MTYVFLALGLITSGVFIAFRKPKVSLKIAFLKAAASMGFVLTAVFAFVENTNCPKLVGCFIVIGAIWGMLGDIWLDLKYVFKNEEKNLLYAGFTCFLVGHIFYLFAYLKAFGLNKLSMIFALVGLSVACIGVQLSEGLLKVKYGKYKIITTLYIGVLGMCLGLNIGYAFSLNLRPVNIMLCVGLALFLLSDALLSGLYFGATEKDKNNRPAIIFNHIFYYSAQFLIAASILYF